MAGNNLGHRGTHTPMLHTKGQMDAHIHGEVSITHKASLITSKCSVLGEF